MSLFSQTLLFALPAQASRNFFTFTWLVQTATNFLSISSSFAHGSNTFIQLDLLTTFYTSDNNAKSLSVFGRTLHSPFKFFP